MDLAVLPARSAAGSPACLQSPSAIASPSLSWHISAFSFPVSLPLPTLCILPNADPESALLGDATMVAIAFLAEIQSQMWLALLSNIPSSFFYG